MRPRSGLQSTTRSLATTRIVQLTNGGRVTWSCDSIFERRQAKGFTMRLAIGEFAHETNSFCPGFTDLDAFKSTFWCEGEAIITFNRGVRNDLGVMIDADERLGIELAPTRATTTQPSATVSKLAYETIRDTLCTRLITAGPVDAICLALHGAGSAHGIEDMEGTFLAELRELVGTEMPIVVSLDLHDAVNMLADNAVLMRQDKLRVLRRANLVGYRTDAVFAQEKMDAFGAN